MSRDSSRTRTSQPDWRREMEDNRHPMRRDRNQEEAEYSFGDKVVAAIFAVAIFLAFGRIR